jgi:hypothetical protein
MSDYRAINLSVKTDGQLYRLQLSSKLIKDNNQYGIVIVAPDDWTQLSIPLSLLKPVTSGTALPLEVALTQVENIIITPLEQPQAFQLLIDDVSLIK